MESVILSGPSKCKIKRKYPLPNQPIEEVQHIDYVNSTDRIQPVEEAEDEYDPYYVWRRNAPFLYDSLMVYNLDWPSLVVKFMDDSQNYRVKNNIVTNRLLLGTHTSGTETEYAMVAELRTGISPLNENLTTCENFNGFLAAKKNRGSNVSFNSTVPALDIKAKIVHPGEINRISHVPNSSFMFTTHTNNGTLLLFDYSKHPSNPRDLTTSIPQLILSNGHDREGYGMSWNSSRKLVSCANDGTVCLWDLNTRPNDKSKGLSGIADDLPIISPVIKFNVDDIPLNDIEFKPRDDNVVVTAGDDGITRLHDLRSKENVSVVNKSDVEVNCLSFNTFDNNIFIIGCSNGLITLCDLRKLNESLKTLKHHTESISQIEFCNGSAGLFATSSYDNTVCIWDFGCVDDELRFIHSGHRDVVTDLSWSKCTQSSILCNGFLLSSVSSDNTLQCYIPNYLVI